MPLLLNCPKCPAQGWNTMPLMESALAQSAHVLRDGKCPVCDSLVSEDWAGQPRVLPQWEETILGGGPRMDYETYAGNEKADKARYHFTHFGLAGLMLAAPIPVLQGLFNDPGIASSVLDDLLGMLGRHFPECDLQELKESIGMDRFTIRHRSPLSEDGRITELPFLLVSLPQPAGIPEAYYVGACPLKPWEEAAQGDRKQQVLFCTLEVATPDYSPSYTTMGRWHFPPGAEDTQHQTYRGGPPPQDPYQFVEYAERIACMLSA